jgi:CBS domain-containing protein
MAIDSRVSLVMTEDVVLIDPDTSVPEVARLMWENNLSSLPVVENDHVIGMITDFDMIARETEYDAPLYVTFLDAYFRVPGSGDRKQLRKILATTARELMTAPAVTVEPDTTVQEAATLMYDKRLNALPVIDANRRLVGILSRADIVRLMVADEDLFDRTHAEAE